jgi:pimeloyl-ACP methyl ester carboxylesterase
MDDETPRGSFATIIVCAPYHPGFGESDDAPTMLDIHDYVMHYVDLLDALGIEKVNLVGFSLGGGIAARFATEHSHRVIKLALVGPAGLRDKEHPTTDVMALPPEQLPALLVSNFEVIKRHLPEKPDLDFMAARYREATTVARLFWERPWDRKLPRQLHRAHDADASALGRGRQDYSRAAGQVVEDARARRRHPNIQGRRPSRARRETGSRDRDRALFRLARQTS